MKFFFIHQRDETGKFPDYPSDEEGGSAIVFNPELRAKMLGEGESWEREESSSSDEEGKKQSKASKADSGEGMLFSLNERM